MSQNDQDVVDELTEGSDSEDEIQSSEFEIDVYDDGLEEGSDPRDEMISSESGMDVCLHEMAYEFGITVMKVRKLLITGGFYSTALSRKVQKEIEQSREFRIETTGLYVYNRICYRG